jgi:hypothetical protein
MSRSLIGIQFVRAFAITGDAALLAPNAGARRCVLSVSDRYVAKFKLAPTTGFSNCMVSSFDWLLYRTSR